MTRRSNTQTRAPSAQAVKKTITITNLQRRPWLVPRSLTGVDLFTSLNVVHPARSIEVSNEAFDKYRKGNKAFSHMLESKLLVATSKKVTVDERDLISDKPAEPPPELGGHGERKTMRVSRTPVAITLSTGKDAEHDFSDVDG